MPVVLTKEIISAAALAAEENYPDCGALVSFEGRVRNHHHGRTVTALEYQAFEPMAELEIGRLCDDIRRDWPACRIRVRHRLGPLLIGDVAVVITVWSPHRREAFAACEAAIDRLKKRVPIWKRETYADGGTEWVICQHSTPKDGCASEPHS